MRLSENFWLSEFEKSQAALRLGISNNVPESLIPNVQALAQNILQPVRDQFGPIIISSGYRSPELNKAIGGAASSKHMLAEAADFEALNRTPNMLIANWIEDNLEFDQLILEFYTPGVRDSGWIHCSYSRTYNRNQTLTAIKTDRGVTYIQGIDRYV